MTATNDMEFCKYWSVCEYSSSNYSIENFIHKNFKNAVINFGNKWECLPDRIIVFREGVS